MGCGSSIPVTDPERQQGIIESLQQSPQQHLGKSLLPHLCYDKPLVVKNDMSWNAGSMALADGTVLGQFWRKGKTTGFEDGKGTSIMITPGSYSIFSAGLDYRSGNPATVLCNRPRGQDCQMIAVTVPQGVNPGQQLQVMGPNGAMMVTVPPGCAAGSIFYIQVNAAAPVQPLAQVNNGVPFYPWAAIKPTGRIPKGAFGASPAAWNSLGIYPVGPDGKTFAAKPAIVVTKDGMWGGFKLTNGCDQLIGVVSQPAMNGRRPITSIVAAGVDPLLIAIAIGEYHNFLRANSGGM